MKGPNRSKNMHEGADARFDACQHPSVDDREVFAGEVPNAQFGNSPLQEPGIPLWARVQEITGETVEIQFIGVGGEIETSDLLSCRPIAYDLLERRSEPLMCTGIRRSGGMSMGSKDRQESERG